MKDDTRKILERIFFAGVDAVDPEKAVKRNVTQTGDLLSIGDRTYDLNRYKDILVVGAGKGTAPMAKALEEILGDRLGAGLIVVKYGHSLPLKKIKTIEAGHPVPDDSGIRGAREMLDLLRQTTEENLVICALSGGGSALLPAPPAPITLADKQQTTQLLLECGATIEEINSIRKHLSISKGGGIAQAAHPATLVSLILSDVVGDQLDVIASGPTVPDKSTFHDCLQIINKYGLKERLPATVTERLEDGAVGRLPETSKPGDPVFERVQNIIVGNNRMALIAAGEEAAANGYQTLLLSSQVQGEAKEVAQVFAAIGKEVCTSAHPVSPPACILAGGETTVTIKGGGKGGRNQELALAAALAIDGWENIAILSAGTDGTDGPTDAAGALVDGGTCKEARDEGLDPNHYLQRNDSYHFFEKTKALFKTGPTRTNVMDMICILID